MTESWRDNDPNVERGNLIKENKSLKAERDRYKVIVQDMANSLCAQEFQTGKKGKCGKCDSCRAQVVLKENKMSDQKENLEESLSFEATKKVVDGFDGLSEEAKYEYANSDFINLVFRGMKQAIPFYPGEDQDKFKQLLEQFKEKVSKYKEGE